MHRFLSALLTCLAVGLLAVAVYAQGPVRYVYDESGRLVGVIDPNGDAAAYTYDAVGNAQYISETIGRWSYTYDKVNRVKTAQDPASKTITCPATTILNRPDTTASILSTPCE